MKNILTLLLLGIFTISTYAQVKVTEGSKTMREGNFNAYSVILDGVSEKEAEDGWKEIMKEYKAKVKKDKKSNLHASDNVQIPSLNNNPTDVYATISENNGGPSTQVSVWFDTGSGYINSVDMPEKTALASAIVLEYGIRVMRTHSEEIQKKEEKKLANLTDEIKNLTDKNNDLIKDIEKAKGNILKWEKELEQNDDDLVKTEEKVTTQKAIVKEAKSETRKY